MNYTRNKTKSIKQFIALLAVLFISTSEMYSQDYGIVPSAPSFALKTNVLYDATSTINLAWEQKLSDRVTLELPVNYNPWNYNNNQKFKHVLAQPEVRYWFCEAFNGTFMGFHAHYGRFNFSKTGLSDYMKEHRFQGWLAGGGISIGHQWVLSGRWSIEATIGVGYAYMDYETFECDDCSVKLKDKTKHYIGPTKAGISLIYVIK